MRILHKTICKLEVLRSSHSEPTNPSGQEQPPFEQVPPFKQEKSLGQTKLIKNRKSLHHDEYTNKKDSTMQ